MFCIYHVLTPRFSRTTASDSRVRGGYPGEMTDSTSDQPRARRHRRVQRAGAQGADPTPHLRPEAAEDDTDHSPSFGTNDEQLRRDVPPHY